MLALVLLSRTNASSDEFHHARKSRVRARLCPCGSCKHVSAASNEHE